MKINPTHCKQNLRCVGGEKGQGKRITETEKQSIRAPGQEGSQVITVMQALGWKVSGINSVYHLHTCTVKLLLDHRGGKSCVVSFLQIIHSILHIKILNLPLQTSQVLL